MRHPWANIALLVLLGAELISGLAGMLNGMDSRSWILWLHSLAAYAILLALVWKGRIILDVLRRRRRIRGPQLAFLVMGGLTLAALAAGFLWSYDGPRYAGGFSVMTLHAVLGAVLAALLSWHVLSRSFILSVNSSHDRRAFIRVAGLSVAGLVLWQAGRLTKNGLHLPGEATRFTGSYDAGSIPAAFPTVSWLFDNPAPIAVARWRLAIDGAVRRPLTLSYAELAGLAGETRVALIDCTGGWYSEQIWSGVTLARLLGLCGVLPDARSITVESVTGYSRRFALAEATSLLLALGVGDQVLDHGHGYPARLVAPGHRGFEWVKWVRRLQVDRTSHILQPPFPLQ